MSSDGVCIAVTHAGVRCASASSDAAGHCAHHARIARVMALVPKSSSSSSSSSASSSVTSPSTTNAYSMDTLKNTVPATNGYTMGYTAPSAVPAPVAAPPPPPAYSSSILQSPLLAAAISSAVSSSNSSSSSGSSSFSSSTRYNAPSSAVGSSSSSKPTTSSSSSTSNSHSWMLPSETQLAVTSASFLLPSTLGLPALPGLLFVTTYRLRFEPQNTALRSPGHFHRLLDHAIEGMPRASVAKLSYPQAATASRYDTAAPAQLVIKFKDLRTWTLGGDITTLMTTLNRHVFVESALSLFAFTTKHRTRDDEARDRDGHTIFNLQRDFERMGVDLQNSAYRISTVNKTYSMCPTYPQQLVVPSTMTDAEILSVADFRSKGRLPICCFVHVRNSASIWRCAQPKRGIFNAQSAADERYLARIATSNRNQQKMWIADCRPELNARVNKFTGGGTESSSLAHASISFLNIANIHAMRESLELVRSLAGSPNPDIDFAWLTRVEETKWLQHVRLVLSAAVRVADAVEHKQTTVLVHCSDGWDRTGQLCALSQMLLDKHYRTVQGFMHVIEKEWILPGHKFHDRVGPGQSEHEEQSPIFLQFLDCVWQIWRLYPTYFEFNEKLLEDVADAVFSGRYGTFLGNCDRERTTWGSATRTPSLWAHILAHPELYTNPFYRPQSEKTLIPPVSALLRNATLWTDYYFRGATFDTIPDGNNCPPTWGSMQAASRSAQQDVADAMAAAVLKIQVLEQELAIVRSGDAGASTASGVSGTLSSLPSPPSVSSPSTPALFGSGSPASVHSVLPPNAWVCSLCSKVNSAASLKCAVCGRSPPLAALTQL